MVIAGGWGQLTTLKLCPFTYVSAHMIRFNSQRIFFFSDASAPNHRSLHFPKVCHFISVSEVFFPRRDFRKSWFRLQVKTTSLGEKKAKDNLPLLSRTLPSCLCEVLLLLLLLADDLAFSFMVWLFCSQALSEPPHTHTTPTFASTCVGC